MPIWKKEIIRNPNSYHGEKSILGTLRDLNVKAQIDDIYKTISENILMFLGKGDYLNKTQKKKKKRNHKSLINVSTLKLSTSSPCSPSPLWGSEILKSTYKCLGLASGWHPKWAELSDWPFLLILFPYCVEFLACMPKRSGVGTSGGEWSMCYS